MKKNELSKTTASAFVENIRKNRRFYLVTLCLTIVIFALMYIGNGVWKEYRDSSVRNQKDQMLLAVESFSGRLEETIDKYASDVRSLWELSRSLNPNKRNFRIVT
ncbi:MAG: hypothetical protein ACLUV8_14290 [Clostridium sp.]